MGNIIEVQNLTKEYNEKGNKFLALNEVNFQVEEGSFIGVMGPSGSGKTTLLNIIATIDKKSAGTVVINNMDLEEIKNKKLADFRRENIGFVFQDFNLLDNMTVRDNISLPLVLNNEKSENILQRIDELSNLLGIKNQLDKYPYELSGGQKQRVAICRALIGNPKLILADEPTGALDSKATYDVLKCFAKVNKELGTTIFMVTHDAKAASFCNRVLFLDDGKISGMLDSSENRNEFFKKILNMLAVMEGCSDELI